MYYVEFFYCLLLFSRLLSTVMNTMKYFDDGIEWAGDHHETSYTSKVMEIPFLQPCSASDRKCVLELWFRSDPLIRCAHYTYLYFIFKDLCEAANNTHCYKCYVYNKTFYETFEIILNYTVMLTSATGLVGNFLSISVLTKTGLCSRFSNLLIMLAYADIRLRHSCRKEYSSACFSYLSMKEVTSVIKCFDLYYPEQNLMNLNHAMYPYFLHPMYKIIQLTTVFITMILRFK